GLQHEGARPLVDHPVRGAVPRESLRPRRGHEAGAGGEHGVSLVGVPGAEFLTLDHPERRAFFKESLKKLAREVTERTERRVATTRYFRPPGAGPELAFLAACTRCGACIDVCPVHAINRLPAGEGLAAGSPALEPARRACVACADMPCAVACPTGALQVPADGWAGIHLGRLALDPERCITFHGSACG